MSRLPGARPLIEWILCLALTAPAVASAATKDEPPDREMIRKLDLLREMELLRQIEMFRDLQNIEVDDKRTRSSAPAGGQPAKPKETAK